MNNIILTVIKRLDNPDSVSLEQLRANAAHAASVITYAAAPCDASAHAAYAASALVYAASAIAYAADAADAAYIVAASDAVSKYFNITGEDKQTYIDAIEVGK